MRTFSELVDAVIKEVGLYGSIDYVVAVVNGIISDLTTEYPSDFDMREHHIMLDNCGYRDFRRQKAITHKWDTPTGFRSIRAVRYDRDSNLFVSNKKPGLVQKGQHKYWYQSGNTIVFVGPAYCIDIAYYVHSRHFVYYPNGKRKLNSDPEHGYLIKSDVKDAPRIPLNRQIPTHEEIYNRHANWLIEQYYPIILDGALGGVYNARGDLVRGGRFYNTYRKNKAKIRTANEHIVHAEI